MKLDLFYHNHGVAYQQSCLNVAVTGSLTRAFTIRKCKVAACSNTAEYLLRWVSTESIITRDLPPLQLIDDSLFCEDCAPSQWEEFRDMLDESAQPE